MKEGWKYKKLGEVCDKVSNLKWQNVPSNSVYSYVDLTAVDRDSFNITNTQSINRENAPSRAKQIIKQNDVLFGTTRPTLRRVCVVEDKNDDDICSTGFCVLRPKSEIVSSKWVFYQLMAEKYYAYIEPLQSGATYPAVTDAVVKSYIIPIPPLSEQQHIVEELDLLSSIIEKKKVQLTELDNLAQSIFYEMFGDPINNEKGWKEKRLDEVCDVRDGTHDSPKYVIESDYVLITSKNIQDGELSFNNVNYITKEDYDKINVRSYVDDGDIIMAMIGTIGKPIIIKKCKKKFGIKNVALLKFRESHDVINVYVKSMLDNPTYMKYLHSLNRGGTQKFISLKTIRNLPILLPPLYLQNQFASKIEAIEHQKELIKQSIKEVETLFNSRMDYYFN